MSRLFHYLTLLAVASLGASVMGQAEKPNILFILTDDQGWPTLGCYGGEIVPTPNLDRLAAEGALLTDFYATSQCTPTRATFLTGQYTARHGLWHVLPWYGYPWARMTEPPFLENYSRETFTLAKGLRQAGYTTAIMGKWHLTSNEDGNYVGINPEAATYYGFDYAPEPIDWAELNEEGMDRGVDELTDQTIDFVSKNRDRPWFAFLSHHMIHGKVVAPEELTEKYRKLGYDDEGDMRAVYLAGLEHTDRSVGRLLKALNEMGEAEDTLVIFTSDNGGIDYRFGSSQVTHYGEQARFPADSYAYDNAPLRMGKGSIYEGGVRVPFIARWPGRIPAGQRLATPAHIVDMAATFFAVAGAEAPASHPLDGASLVRLLRGEGAANLEQRPVFQYYPFYDLLWGLTPSASIRKGRYKLIEFFGDRVTDAGEYLPGYAVELYDLARDLGESQDLSRSEPELAKELQGELRKWIEEIGAQIPQANPRHDRDRRFVKARDKPSWLEGR